MGVVSRALFYIFIYLPIYFLFTVIQRLYWRCTGLYDIVDQIESGQLYERSAHIFNIKWKLKKEAFQPISRFNFLGTHCRFAHPRYVLNNNVSLIAVTSETAIFVETPPSYDIYDCRESPFIHLGQFDQSYRLICLPLTSLIKLGQEIGDPKPKVIWLHSTGRCGSTALSRVFEAVPGCTTISEPMCLFTFRSSMAERLPDSDFRKYITDYDYLETVRATVRLMCKPNPHDPEFIFIKNFTLCGTNEVPDLRNFFPSHTHLYLYRDCLPTVQSYWRSLNQHFLLNLVLRLRKWAVTRYIVRTPTLLVKMLASPDIIDENTWLKAHYLDISALGLLVLQWAFYCAHYSSLVARGVPIRAVRYEQLLAKPTETVAAMLQFCGILDKHVTPAVAALDEDSQQGTVLSRSNLSTARKIVLTEELREECNGYLHRFKFESLGEPALLPGILYQDNDVNSLSPAPSAEEVRISMTSVLDMAASN